ncbi:hypothetical protein N865_10105 [Intrasporangium oryzae NRRL B-24470]|uniref:Zinc-finger domain-containing protein n=1 Tax=Intrasporangium oryzae NRRL B-24470 TaxID=1386089 RepID=W9G675_9MICO|nr:hypothetical protein [Intrasporangium oryzae]EWT01490.1 hypothetical protein N865_10105 [Intrasporangium oryzae NRRL B-24470]
MTPDPRRLTSTDAQRLIMPTDPWLSCEDCFELTDRFAEELLAHPDTTHLPEMLVHLHACAACAEEAESLIVLLAADVGADPAAALDRLRG